MATAYVGQMIDVDSEGNERLLHPETVIDAIPGLRDLLNGFQDGIDGLNAAMSKMAYGNYKGTNSVTPAVINVDFTPEVIFFIWGDSSKTYVENYGNYVTKLYSKLSSQFMIWNNTMSTMTWGTNSLKISGSNANACMNGDYRYYWVIFGK